MSSLFHENTKRVPSGIAVGDSEQLYGPDLPHFKSYPRFTKISLPKDASFTVDEATQQRKTQFAGRPLSLMEISKVLFNSVGIIHTEEDIHYRAAPSIGLRYPLEAYPVVFQSQEVTTGIYHYNIYAHALESIEEGDFRKQIINSTRKQEGIQDASMVILISAIFERTEMVYGDRGYRYVFLDAGHLAQKICTTARSMGLSCCSIGEFLDDELNKLLDLDGAHETVIYLVAIGGMKRSVTKAFRSLFGST